MTSRDLYFDVERTDSNIVTLSFNTPQETKLAFRALMELLGADSGIYLVARPIYKIVLDNSKGGWQAWCRVMTPYVTEVAAVERYKLTLIDGKIGSRKTIYPLSIYTNSILRGTP